MAHFFLSKWLIFFLTNAIGELPLGIVRLSVGLAHIEKVHELCIRAASEYRCGMLAAPYVPSDIVPLVDCSAHFRFRVLESKKHCLAEIEPPEAGGHSERLLPYLRTAELGKPMVVYLGDFVESAHGYLREMKNGAIFRLLHGWLFSGKLTDTLFSSFQFFFLCCVPAVAAVLVLLNRQLHKPGFMLCCIARHFPQIRENARSQKVSADKMRGAVMGAFLVDPTDIAVLLSLT